MPAMRPLGGMPWGGERRQQSKVELDVTTARRPTCLDVCTCCSGVVMMSSVFTGWTRNRGCLRVLSKSKESKKYSVQGVRWCPGMNAGSCAVCCLHASPFRCANVIMSHCKYHCIRMCRRCRSQNVTMSQCADLKMSQCHNVSGDADLCLPELIPWALLPCVYGLLLSRVVLHFCKIMWCFPKLFPWDAWLMRV
ncbi:hypothetical protein DUNSADRAFT_8012 [Dunaliella salina]|uniref:Uncharacterized protein n=1 Tax=Dunaliella salina TaxID=3046 RepID=A0ABQ7GK59_DUNSA|nr:hypothetical protein DUNSADRAFT_8012 [Dunaliella salina]|eukprot:KAF5835009.1 hypothetical protein DUNSADRAFT_8012 [Dunaliella salina]